jgi:hypothetical protein
MQRFKIRIHLICNAYGDGTSVEMNTPPCASFVQ